MATVIGLGMRIDKHVVVLIDKTKFVSHATHTNSTVPWMTLFICINVYKINIYDTHLGWLYHWSRHPGTVSH